MGDFNRWLKINRNALEHLYYHLIDLSLSYGIKIIDSEETVNNFIYMMYNESSKRVINKELYPEFFYRKFNSQGYEKYQII
jgi:hypothetical protein